MTEQILEYLEFAGHGLSLFAVAVIISGFAVSAAGYAWRLRQSGPEKDFQKFKVELGEALILGLEILVLADVIETITTELSFLSLAVLASLVVIRTIISWTLVLETEGHWPWQAPAGESDESAAESGEARRA